MDHVRLGPAVPQRNGSLRGTRPARRRRQPETRRIPGPTRSGVDGAASRRCAHRPAQLRLRYRRRPGGERGPGGGKRPGGDLRRLVAEYTPALSHYCHLTPGDIETLTYEQWLRYKLFIDTMLKR